jgi:hypothetical protein
MLGSHCLFTSIVVFNTNGSYYYLVLCIRVNIYTRAVMGTSVYTCINVLMHEELNL